MQDFRLLLDALRQYNAREEGTGARRLPRLVVVVTGKGPQRAMYVGIPFVWVCVSVCVGGGGGGEQCGTPALSVCAGPACEP